MNTNYRIKQTIFALAVLSCSACAGQGQQKSQLIAAEKNHDSGNRPCSVEQAYFDGLQAQEASNRCTATQRTAYLEAWEKGLNDARLNNELYIRKARDIQLQALEDLQADSDSETREKAERLFRNMNTRIETLNHQNEKLTALQLTLNRPQQANEASHTTTAAKE